MKSKTTHFLNSGIKIESESLIIMIRDFHHSSQKIIEMNRKLQIKCEHLKTKSCEDFEIFRTLFQAKPYQDVVGIMQHFYQTIWDQFHNYGFWLNVDETISNQLKTNKQTKSSANDNWRTQSYVCLTLRNHKFQPQNRQIPT